MAGEETVDVFDAEMVLEFNIVVVPVVIFDAEVAVKDEAVDAEM